MGKAAEERGLPRELPVMASLVESGMRNLSYGDADSVGFFQMRTSIWNSGSYIGYGKDPELQLKWFLDQAVTVKKQRLAAGKSVTDPSQFGEWIADIERPAAQYRGRYQLRLSEARELFGQVEVPTAGRRAIAAVAEARAQLGTKYVWGGESPDSGFDCSGLVQWAYKQVGIDIPRVTYDQFKVGKSVDRNHLVPGDIVFFRDASGDLHHEGISLGGDRFLHAPHTGDSVKISSLREPYYAKEFAGARRVDR
jgi:cell wall-associated NlpC family hydrolase